MADAWGDLGLGGAQGQMPLETWFWETPACTRWWTTGTVIVAILVQCKIIGPYQLFYSYRGVFYRGQYWRLISPFFYFGPLSLDLLFHVFFLQRYPKYLERASGPTPAKFCYMLLFVCVFLLMLSPFVGLPFLGNSLSSTLVYIWSRRNPHTMLSFLGLLVFSAPYLPFVLIGFSIIIHGAAPKDEVVGLVVGQAYFFLADTLPGMSGGWRPLEPPRWWMRLFEGRPREVEQTEPVRVDGEMVAAAAEAR